MTFETTITPQYLRGKTKDEIIDHVMRLLKENDDLEKSRADLARLLIESRDCLPAIPAYAATLRGISLTLADRIDTALEPWEVKE